MRTPDPRGVLARIAASGPAPEYAEGLMLYGQFVGSWTVSCTWFARDGSQKTANGEWHFAWILGGRGIQDVLYACGAPPTHYGTTIRCYDVRRDIWHVCWMHPDSGEYVNLVAVQKGDRIIQEGAGAEPGQIVRWSFTEIRDDSFVWLGEVSVDGGASWFLEQEMRVTRIGEPPIGPQRVGMHPASADDYEFSYEVKKAAEGALIAQTFGWDEGFQRRYHREDWLRNSPSIITVDGRPVGTVELREEGRTLHVRQFFILPEFQGKGVGSEVLHRALERADERRLETRLVLIAGNRCESLYRRHGFEAVSESGALRVMSRRPVLRGPRGTGVSGRERGDCERPA